MHEAPNQFLKFRTLNSKPWVSTVFGCGFYYQGAVCLRGKRRHIWDRQPGVDGWGWRQSEAWRSRWALAGPDFFLVNKKPIMVWMLVANTGLITPLKINMTGWKIHHEWRCICYWTWGFSNVIVGFQGCNNPGGDWHAGWGVDPDHASKKLSLFDQTSDHFKRFPLTKDDEIRFLIHDDDPL